MTFSLRHYQEDAVEAFYDSVGNTLIVQPTGSGKTVVSSEIIKRWKWGHVCVMAHRQELVSQISCALARDGVEHTIVASKSVIKNCTKLHVQMFGKVFYKTRATVILASVQTLVRRDNSSWAGLVKLWVIDEAHHVLKENIWGKAALSFPNARGLGVTATPIRSDGKALGIEHDGLFHNMIVGETMLNLIRDGYLCPYRVFSPPTKTLDLSAVTISQTTGDYSRTKLAEAVGKSQIHGDIVAQYKRLAMGKRGVTFVPSVETAKKVALAFQEAGIPTEVVSASTPDMIRISLVERLRRGDLLQLVNVDLFGEGFDLPAIEVVSMARPTKSYSLYSQQLGRALRPMEGKQYAIIIDHVGNVVEHGLPEFNEQWTLGYYTEKKGRGGSGKPLFKVCPACTGAHERFLKICPYCGYIHRTNEGERNLEQVDGDLIELDPQELARLRALKARVEGEPVYPFNASPMIRSSVRKNHDARKSHLMVVKWYMSEWIGNHKIQGFSESDIYRKFYLEFGTDVLTAQTERNNALLEKLAKSLGIA